MDDVKQRILQQLHTGVAQVVFTKRDGTQRQMHCTLHENFMPVSAKDSSNQTRKENPDVQRVWDVDKKAWRSFRWDSLVDDSNG